MAQDRFKQTLQQGIAAAKAGQKDQAFQILQRAVKQNPRSETAWLWLSSVARNEQERAFCLKQLYAINPNNELAIKGLQALGIDPTAEPVSAEPTPQSDTPQVTMETLRGLQGDIDNLVNNYRPRLYTPLEIDWVRKEKNRYGEATARRVKRTFQATIAGVSVVALGLVGFLLFALISSLGGSEELAGNNKGLFTATPSLVPSITPTFTPNPNTPIPPALFTTPTPATPERAVPRGDEFTAPDPTSIYPDIRQPEIREALISFDAEDYDAVRAISEPFQDPELRVCLQESYYYDAVGRAQLGGEENLDSAEAILRRALRFETDQGFDNTCADSQLLQAGLCFVRYRQALASPANATTLLNEAIAICQEAHDEDPRLVSAAITLADIYLLRGNYDAAISVMQDTRAFQTATGLQPNIGDLNLLMKLAEAETAQQNYDAALNYISIALFVDPAFEPALVEQVELYLLRAERTPNQQTKEILYGYAAVVAEEQYLFRYPGAALGYVQVAEGRLREGNPDRALDYLNRVLQVAGEPGVDEAAVLRGRGVLAEILIGEQRWAEAIEQLNLLIEANPSNVQWRDWRQTAALAIDNYELALEDLDFLLTQFEPQSTWVVNAAHIRSQICQNERTIRCDYNEVESNLSNGFIDTISDPLLAARATAYLTEATFANLPATPSSAALTTLAEQLQIAMQVYETAENHYLLARIQNANENYAAATESLKWVAFWDAIYAYPFADDAAELLESIATLQDENTESS